MNKYNIILKLTGTNYSIYYQQVVSVTIRVLIGFEGSVRCL